jgi:NCS1 family nucleobase:cation symporter-1
MRVTHVFPAPPPGGGAAGAFEGRMPQAPGDLRVEAHGIAPVPESNRYGGPGRLFTMWFAPNLTMTGVFTGTLGVVLGLDFATALVAVALGTVIGALPTAYLGTWGSRTGAGQLPLARLAFGRAVVLPAGLQWLSSVAWDALIGLFGGDALARLFGWPFWVGVLVILVAEGALGVLGYEAVHRLQIVMTFVLAVAFALIAWKLLDGVHPAATGWAHGADRAGAFLLTSTVALSLSLSWAPYASDFSRYLPVTASRARMFWFSFLGIVVSFLAVQALGLWGASVLTDQTAAGVDELLGGGPLGAFGLLAVALAALCSNTMNDYSGSLALQTAGVRLPRPAAAARAAALGFPLVLWMHAADTATRFQNVLLFVSCWIPGFVAIVAVDWLARARARGGSRGCGSSRSDASVDLAAESAAGPRTVVAAPVAFVASFAAAVPFMNTGLYVGPVADVLHGADLSYYVAFLAALALYAPFRLRGTDVAAAGDGAAPGSRGPAARAR